MTPEIAIESSKGKTEKFFSDIKVPRAKKATFPRYNTAAVFLVSGSRIFVAAYGNP